MKKQDVKKDISYYQQGFEGAGPEFRTNYWDKQRILKALKLLGVFDCKGERALDFGCGAGTFTPYVKSSFNIVIGIDVTATNLKIARNADKTCEYLCYDGNRLPFEDKSFNAVFCGAVLYQFPDLAEPLTEINRVLVKDGLLFISEPNSWNPMGFIQYHTKSTEEWKRGDPRPLSYLYIKRKLIQTGFKCLKRRGINFSPIEAKGIWRLARIIEPYVESLPLVHLLGGSLLITAKKEKDLAK